MSATESQEKEKSIFEAGTPQIEQNEEEKEIIEEKTTAIQPQENNVDDTSQISPQDQFFNFYQDNHGNPVYTNEFETVDDRKLAQQILASSSNSDTSNSKSSINQTTCCFLCLLVLIATALITTGVGLNYGFMPPPKHHTNDPNFPECNANLFNVEIKPKIAIPLSKSIREMKETHKLENDGYEMNIDSSIIEQIVTEIQNVETEMILLYGAIEKHKGTIQLFDQIEESMDELINIWLVDPAILLKYNGTVHERCACLFNRADEWEKGHSNYKLLVIFDHFSHYYQENEHNIADRGIVWNQLQSLFVWKKNRKWTLFIVESNPNMLTVEDMHYAQRIFSKNSKAKSICISFNGAMLFKNVMDRLINNTQDIQLHFNHSQDEQWDKLMNDMQYFTIYDAFNIYHTRIRMEAHEKQKKQGIPIIFQFEDISTIVQQYNAQFQDEDVNKMKQFAHSIGAKCFNEQQEEIDADNHTQQITAAHSKPHSKKSKVTKRTIILIATIMAIIVVLVLLVWSCYMVVII